ncbi:MAG: S-methyl-5-thioribose-1-phosphate isomerase [Polyangiaceae bacterium]
MLVEGVHRRTIWLADDGHTVEVLDQTALPREVRVVRLGSCEDAARAIETMIVRGAPLIGVSAAYGLALALRDDPSDAGLARAHARLGRTRPTAVNLHWALDRARAHLAPMHASERAAAAYALAAVMADEDVDVCSRIGEHGATALREVLARRGGSGPLRVLTHCNAGWLATVDWGTALAPVYKLHDAGVPIHVWVDETRPRNQGYLTAWELAQHGVPATLIVDNAGGHYLQRGEVDVCIVGSDRTTRIGDVCNKIGTYLKALAAHDARVPFYAAVPSSTIDFSIERGDAIPIEERSASEVTDLPFAKVKNPAFDVTPARLVTGIVTERGVAPATAAGLAALFPERA